MKVNTTTKKANYTEEMESRMRAVYDPKAAESVRDAQVKQLAQELGKSTRSIIAKLGSMDGGLYVPRDPAAQKPSVKRGPSRAEIVRDIEAVLGLQRDALASLARSHRKDLLTLKGSVTDSES